VAFPIINRVKAINRIESPLSLHAVRLELRGKLA